MEYFGCCFLRRCKILASIIIIVLTNINNAAFLEDAAQNADLYIANQDVSMQI